uniref:Uncharacterized protein n=1 Tax=Arundo donax TaxID=35708 RepID=A0A0A9BTD8_ARUDO
MYYTNEEDLRFVSAWLNNSTDSIERNFKET